MALIPILAGQRITADLIASIAPLAVIKPNDQSVTSSTVLVNDTSLVEAVDADATYLFACYLDYEGGTQGSSDIQWEWSGPSGYTLRYWSGHITTGGAFVMTSYKGTDNPSAGSNGAGVIQGAFMFGTLVVASTAGNLQLQWAQNSSSATPTIVHAQSCLALWRVS